MGFSSTAPTMLPLGTALAGAVTRTGDAATNSAPDTLVPPAMPAVAAPTFTAPQIDLSAPQAAANAASVASLQNIAQLDTASILARYGTQLSMAGAFGGSPLLR